MLGHGAAAVDASDGASALHASGSVALRGSGSGAARTVDVEYWSAGPRYRLSFHGGRAGLPAFDFEIACDGVRVTLLERGVGVPRIFASERSAERGGLVLRSAARGLEYRVSLSSDDARLPVRIERTPGGGKADLRVELMFKVLAVEDVRFPAPQRLALTSYGEDGSVSVTTGGIVLGPPKAEAVSDALFALDTGL
jgi:hypothetical protein